MTHRSSEEIFGGLHVLLKDPTSEPPIHFSKVVLALNGQATRHGYHPSNFKEVDKVRYIWLTSKHLLYPLMDIRT